MIPVASTDRDRFRRSEGTHGLRDAVDLTPQWVVMSTPSAATSPTVAILLAAGAGSRFTGPGHKLLAPFRGSTVIRHSLAAVLAAGFDAVIVVTGAADIATQLPDDPRLPGEPPLIVVHNPAWADGQATSVWCGIDRARELGAEQVVIGLADQPMVTSNAWRAVASRRSPIAVATYDGVRGNPVRLHSSVWHLVPTHGDTGARDLIRLHPELVSQVACEGSGADIDTHEDLDTWT